MKENEKKAFDFAADTTKQLIGISTGIIALMVTFSKEIIGSSTASPKILLAWTWGIFIVSIIFGILTLMALTGTLQPIKKEPIQEGNDEDDKQATVKTEIPDIDLDINNNNIRLFSGLQILSFLIAIILTAIFGYKSLNNGNLKPEENNRQPIIRKSYLNNDTTTMYIDTIYIDELKGANH